MLQHTIEYLEVYMGRCQTITCGRSVPKSKRSKTKGYLCRMCPKRTCGALSVSTAVIIPHMVILHDAHRPCSPLMSVPVTRYINIMLLIIRAHNVTPDLRSVLHNARLMYTTYVQRLLSTWP